MSVGGGERPVRDLPNSSGLLGTRDGPSHVPARDRMPFVRRGMRAAQHNCFGPDRCVSLEHLDLEGLRDVEIDWH